MGLVEPVVRGELAHHPSARRLADEVVRAHVRYAVEVVERFQLCPFMRDAASGFGRFCVLLDREPLLEETLAAAREVDSAVVHLVFPCIRTPATAFERFAAKVGEALRRGPPADGAPLLLPMQDPKASVLAAFHPEMAGDDTSSHRLVGLLRRAPDPFVQLIPPGLSEGGTVLIDAADAGRDPAFAGPSGMAPAEDRAEAMFLRLQGEGLAAIRAAIAAIQAERDARYAPYLEALGLARPGPRFG
jgi:hypothetical protein